MDHVELNLRIWTVSLAFLSKSLHLFVKFIVIREFDGSFQELIT